MRAGAGAGARRRRRRPSGGRGRAACRTLDRSSGAAAAERRRAPGPRRALRRARSAAATACRVSLRPAAARCPGEPAPGAGPRAVSRSRSPPAAERSAAAGGGAAVEAAGLWRGGAEPRKAWVRARGPSPWGPLRPGQRSAAEPRLVLRTILFSTQIRRGSTRPPEIPRLLPGAAARSVSCFFPPAGRLGAQGRGPPPGAQRHHGHGAVPVPQLPQGHAV